MNHAHPKETILGTLKDISNLLDIESLVQTKNSTLVIMAAILYCLQNSPRPQPALFNAKVSRGFINFKKGELIYRDMVATERFDLN